MRSKLGVVFSEEEIPAFCWYEWIPPALIASEVSAYGDWFADQAFAAIRDGGRAVWIWSQ